MNKPLIIAEISGNHMGSLERALKIVHMAAWAGADYIKLQTYTPDEMVYKRDYALSGGLWDGQNLHELYKQGHTPREWHQELFDFARQIGIEIFSTPFSIEDVEFLETLDCPMYKVASMEITDLELIKGISETRKPMVISTGGATKNEISRALNAAWKSPEITLMKCTAAYPAPLEDRNLVTMLDMGRMFNKAKIGLSDHSNGTDDAIIATALGASMIEKHITLDDMQGPDAAFSLTPTEFKLMVNQVTYSAKALGTVKYGPTSQEMVHLRRSLYFTQDMSKGDYLAPHHVVTARPALGIPASRMNMFDRGVYQVSRDIKNGEPVQESDIMLVESNISLSPHGGSG